MDSSSPRKCIAGVIIEPVIMTGGALPAERGFPKAVQDAPESYGAVLILDEVVNIYSSFWIEIRI